MSVHARKRTAFNCPFLFIAGVCIDNISALHGHLSSINEVEAADELCIVREGYGKLKSAPVYKFT